MSERVICPSCDMTVTVVGGWAYDDLGGELVAHGCLGAFVCEVRDDLTPWIVEALGDKGKLVGYYECRDEPQAMRLAWILREDDIEALVYPEGPSRDELDPDPWAYASPSDDDPEETEMDRESERANGN